MARRSRRGPARWPLLVLAVALVAGGVIAFLGRDDGEEVADGPRIETPINVDIESVDGDPAPVTVARTPYTIEYRVEGFTADGGAVIDTERRWVRPPFESRVETIPGDDGSSDVSFLQVAGFGFVQTGREHESPVVLATEPTVAPGDVRIDVSSLEWRGQQREVLDRTCEVYRAPAPIDVATPTDPEPDSWADVCVDSTGLVLHEEWVIGGDVFRRRIARALDESPSFDDEFEPTGERPGGAEGGVLARVTDDSQPPDVAIYTLPKAPDGFRFEGRYGFTPPRAAAQGLELEPTRVAAIIDLYEDGDGGIVVVANGGTNDLSDIVTVVEGAETVDLGGELGTAELVRGLRQHEVRAGLDRGRFVRLWATLPADDVVALARTLEPITRADSTVERA